MEQAARGAPVFSAQEREYYQQLFSIADRDGNGFINGNNGAAFLSTSLLPDYVLGQIWQIADPDQQGILTPQGFCVALRLVAHVQAGLAPAPDLALAEPSALPDLPGLRRERSPSECSPTPGSVAASVALEVASELHDWPPVIGLEPPSGPPPPAERWQRSPAPLRSGDRGVNPHELWAPSAREKRKYAGLFKRTDADGDGLVQGHEAQALLLRSGLEMGVLAAAWEHADLDRDGQLNFGEFVILVHIVTCVLRGMPLPGLEEGLPPDLARAVSGLESPEVLLAQQEALCSRGQSPRSSSRAASPFRFPSTPTAQARPDADGGGGACGGFQSFDADAFPAFSQGDFASPWAGSGATPAEAEAEAEQNQGGKKERRSKKGKKDSAFSAFDAFDAASPFGGDQVDFAGDFGFPGGLLESQEPSAPAWTDGAADAPDRPDRDQGSIRGVEGEGEESLAGLFAAHCEALVALDHEATRQLQADVDSLGAELRRVQEVHSELEEQVQQSGNEQRLLDEQGRGLERKLQDALSQLNRLSEARRAASMEDSLRRDRDSFERELAYLRRATEREESSLRDLGRANQCIEKSCCDIEAHMEVLEKQRKVLRQQVSQEEELLRQAERASAELAAKAERLGRARAATLSGGEEGARRRIAAERRNEVGAAAWRSAERAEHSWAVKVTHATSAPSSPLNSNTGSRFMSTGGRRSRLGV